MPFTPGWDLVGVVDRVGDRVSGIEPGMVAALPISCAYAEFVCMPQRELVPVLILGMIALKVGPIWPIRARSAGLYSNPSVVQLKHFQRTARFFSRDGGPSGDPGQVGLTHKVKTGSCHTG